MGRRWMVVACVLAAGVLARHPAAPAAEPDADTDTVPLISAERLGDADAPEEHELSPAEREALNAQGYELEIDDRIVTQTRIQPPKSETQKKGPWGRTMDTIGRGFVAVASVALPLAAAVAPFLLF